MDLVACPLEELDQDAEKEAAQMKKAADEQETKMREILRNKNKDKIKVVINAKRKISECTEAPNSPLRKTKAVKKEKS
jgi:hypothetical protein